MSRLPLTIKMDIFQRKSNITLYVIAPINSIDAIDVNFAKPLQIYNTAC